MSHLAHQAWTLCAWPATGLVCISSQHALRTSGSGAAGTAQHPAVITCNSRDPSA